MSEKKLIVVAGATGAQGGGLVRAILSDPDTTFSVRGLTRNVDSDKAKALTPAGAQMVAADFDDPESLNEAFAGAHGAFLVTNFWEHFSPEKEIAQATALADAVKHAGVEHVVWSTLEDTRNWVPLDDDRMPTLMGRYKVPHFDAKGEADGLFTSRGIPTTFLRTSFYWDNFIQFGMGPVRGDDGKLAITFPMGDKKLPGISVADIGRCAYGIFKEGPGLVGETISIAGEHLTGHEMAAALSTAIGEEVGYNDVPPEAYRNFGFPGAEDLGNMFQFKRDFEEMFCGARDLVRTRALNPQLQTFADWLAEYGSQIPIDS